MLSQIPFGLDRSEKSKNLQTETDTLGVPTGSLLLGMFVLSTPYSRYVPYSGYALLLLLLAYFLTFSLSDSLPGVLTVF